MRGDASRPGIENWHYKITDRIYTREKYEKIDEGIFENLAGTGAKLWRERTA
jgi:hypothetical protein